VNIRPALIAFGCCLLAAAMPACVGANRADTKAAALLEPSGAADAEPSPFDGWKAGTEVSAAQVEAYGEERCFAAEPVSDAVFARMRGKSYPDGCPIKRSDLRYVRALHCDAAGRIRLGEMVCHKQIAADLVDIFRELYRQKYPIERMILIDEYGADDETSMRANNSSSFCYRTIAGSRTVSKHARGMAVDINTLYNPYVRRRKNGTLFVQPATATPYIDRARAFPYKITRDDLCCRLFRAHGFRWGGDWRGYKDYQHFYK